MFSPELTLLFLYIIGSTTGTSCPNLESRMTNGFVTGFFNSPACRIFFWTMFAVLADVPEVYLNAGRFGSDATPAGRFGTSVPAVSEKFSLKYRSRSKGVSGVLGMKMSNARMRTNIMYLLVFVFGSPPLWNFSQHGSESAWAEAGPLSCAFVFGSCTFLLLRPRKPNGTMASSLQTHLMILLCSDSYRYRIFVVRNTCIN